MAGEEIERIDTPLNLYELLVVIDAVEHDWPDYLLHDIYLEGDLNDSAVRLVHHRPS